MLNEKVNNYIDNLICRYSNLNVCKDDIVKSYELLKNVVINDGKVLIAGNGGSAADSEHIVGELMKSFVKKRNLSREEKNKILGINQELGNVIANNLQGAIPAIALDGHSALTTAYMNDCEPDLCFAQQVNGYGRKNDLFWGISTSGNSKNVIYASIVAKAKGLKIIGLTGEKESKLSNIADVCIRVPEIETYKIQELHLPIYHCLCLMLEETFFEE